MAGVFETAAKSAIREILLNGMQESKFGFIVSHDNLDILNEQLFDLFVTSRNLKSAGDRMLAQGLSPTPAKDLRRTSRP